MSFDRRSVLVNLGGGTITDLGGYVAASYLRGVAYVNIPTTLLAQHDSGIGGKVAVNAPWAKNFIGAFHHPRAVLCDPGVLATLGDRDVRCGVAESIKVALCGAPGLFELLERQVDAVIGRDPAVLEEVVRRSAGHKIALLVPDPYEVDLRRVLNLGHTFGHALEVELAYEDLQHGEAVAYGIAVATLIAAESGECPTDDARRILDLIGRYRILAPVDPERLHAAAKRVDDVRLVRGGRLNYVLPTTVRSVEVVPELADHRIHPGRGRPGGAPAPGLAHGVSGPAVTLGVDLGGTKALASAWQGDREVWSASRRPGATWALRPASGWWPTWSPRRPSRLRCTVWASGSPGWWSRARAGCGCRSSSTGGTGSHWLSCSWSGPGARPWSTTTSTTRHGRRWRHGRRRGVA